jgi:hypothetical protein
MCLYPLGPGRRHHFDFLDSKNQYNTASAILSGLRQSLIGLGLDVSGLPSSPSPRQRRVLYGYLSRNVTVIIMHKALQRGCLCLLGQMWWTTASCHRPRAPALKSIRGKTATKALILLCLLCKDVVSGLYDKAFTGVPLVVYLEKVSRTYCM